MADNERVQYDIDDIPYEQTAPSKAGRTNFTPGKASAEPLDENWPEEFRIPTGNRAIDEADVGPTEVTRARTVKLARNTVADTELRAPTVIRTIVSTVDDPDAGICGTHQVTETETQNPSLAEKNQEGYDWAEGA